MRASRSENAPKASVGAAGDATASMPARRASTVMRVLVVDDDPDTVTTLQEALPVLVPGILVEGAGSAQEAMHRAREQAYDIVVTDDRMPAMRGNSLLAWFRDEQPQAWRVLMSGAKEPERDGVAQHFLSKPFDLKALRRMLPANRKGDGSTPGVKQDRGKARPNGPGGPGLP